MIVSNHTREFRHWLRTSVVIVVLGIGVAALTSCTVTYKERPTPRPPEPEVVYVEEPVTFPDAFPELARHGSWVEVEGLGWAWSPNVHDAWRPYYHGHWAWSNGDWTWVSYEPYGWAVYHYGNWSLDAYWGWLWFPDYEWRPNRVAWVTYQDYVAWAPIPAMGYAIGDPWVPEYAQAWNVCHVANFTSPYVGDHHVVGFAPRHHRVNRYVVTRAPQPTYIYQRCGVRVTPVRLTTRPVAGHDHRIKRIHWTPQDQLRMKKHRTRTYKELYDPRNKPTPMTRPGIPDVDRRPHNDGPTPMTRPGIPDVDRRPHNGGPTPMTPPELDRRKYNDGDQYPPADPPDVDRRTPKDGPTPMTRPDKRDAGNDGPIIITTGDDKRTGKKTKPTKPNRQDPGKKDRKGNWARPDDTKPNRQDPGTRDEKGNWKRPEDTRPNRQQPDKKDLKNDSKPNRQDPGKKEDDKSGRKDDKDKKDKEGKDKKDDDRKGKKDDDKSDDDDSKSKKDQKDKDKKDDDKQDKKGKKDKDDDDDESESDDEDAASKDKKKGKGKGKK